MGTNKPFALPVLSEGSPPYEEISSNDAYFDCPQSAIMVTCIIFYMSSNNVFSLIASEKYEFY